MFHAKRPSHADIPRPANGREFTTQERAEIAARYERLATDYRREQRELDALDPEALHWPAEHLAIDAEYVARAARRSSEALTHMLNNLVSLHR